MVACETGAKIATLGFLEEVVSSAITHGRPVDQLRGVAFFDMARDAALTSLKKFEAAEQAITGIPNLVGRFGTDAAPRIVLQFVYQYFRHLDVVQFQEAEFDRLWCDLV